MLFFKEVYAHVAEIILSCRLALEGEMNDEAEPSTPTRGSVVKIKFNGAHG